MGTKITIYINDETFDTLQMFRKPNETVSKAISRAIRKADENAIEMIIHERLEELFKKKDEK